MPYALGWNGSPRLEPMPKAKTYVMSTAATYGDGWNLRRRDDGKNTWTRPRRIIACFAASSALVAACFAQMAAFGAHGRVFGADGRVFGAHERA